MNLPFFYPPPLYRQRLNLSGAIELRDLCTLAGVNCRASGPWTKRLIVISRGPDYRIEVEAGGTDAAHICVPMKLKPLEAYRHALGALAYSLMDPVARESVKGQPWTRPAKPRGRPHIGSALNGRERQRKLVRRYDP